MIARRFETRPTTATEYLVGPGSWSADPVDAVLDARPLVAVVDREVDEHHGPRVADLLDGREVLGRRDVVGGEQCKDLASLDSLLTWFEQARLPKHGVVVVIGGGTVSDLTSLAATLMRRSVDLVLFPTTLLAQVDAAVGGKNGINSSTTKNVFGHFHHPRVVASDPMLLATLPDRQLVSGLAECLKVFAVGSTSALERHRHVLGRDRSVEALTAMVAEAQGLKLDLLAEDPYEESSRRLLNYGHAFAHLLEERSGYELLHGEAVLVGMLLENEISAELGMAGPTVAAVSDQIVDLLPAACQRHWVPYHATLEELPKVRDMRRAQMNYVCLEAPGRAKIVDDIEDDLLATCWRRVGELIESRDP